MRSSYQSANIPPVDLRNERFHKQLELVYSKEAECSLLYGKPLERDSSPHTDGSFSTARHSLTDLLVTKLIKGDIPDVIKVATDSLPVHGNKKQSCSQREHSRAQLTDTSNNKEITSETEKDTQNINDDNLIGEGNKRKANQPKKQQEDRAVTICPIKTAPTRLAIEGNLNGLGLHSIQAPVAFCSNLQDLPDRPVEHGGRVLKVESRRICELSPFTTSQHIIGIWEWRKKSVASSKLLASQSIGKALLERLQQEAQLRLMMAGDHKVILAPIHCPPSHASVVTWLLKNMATVREEKLKQERKSAPTNSNSLVDDLQLEERQKSDILSYNPDDSFLKDANQSSDTLEKNTCEIHSVKKSGENNSSISKADHSISNSLDDSSTLIDTDLELSCTTPTETPAPIVSPAEALTLSNPSAVTSPQDSHATPPSEGQVIQRKRKLKFEDNGSQSSSQENSISNPNILDEHFRKTKRRLVNFRNLNDKIELLVTTMSSTPVRRTSNDLFDPTCTPISSPQDVQDRSKQMIPTLGSEQVEKPAKKSQSMDKPTPVIKPVSTSTENLLKDNFLTSQTQRKFSNLGLTTAEVSQIEGPTPKNSFGFKVPQTHVQDAKALHKYQYVTTLSVELHIETRGDLKPDPEFDAIQAVFYSVLDDIPADQGRRNITGVILVDKDSWSNIAHRLESDKTSKDKSLSPGKINMLSAYPSELPSTSTFPHTSDNPTIPCRSQVPMCNPNLEKIKGEHPTTSPSLQSVSKPERGQALLEKCAVDDLEVTYVQDEMDIINTFTQLVSSFDPDILVGYEIQMLSWGYLLQRAAHLNVDLCSKIARVQDSKENNHFTSEKDEWGADHMSEIHVAGRIVLNLWRILRHEVALNVYSFESVAFHVLHRRIPLYSFRTLTKWYNNRTFLQRWRVFEHYTARVKGQLEIIDQLDLIGKTSEFARVFGIEFYDVLARGSQIRVESMMLRIAKPLNYVAVSPGVNQRARQRAPECIPLNLEPESKYYTSPVVVLDFQSLYPSIMIAYNYCFSTCLGRLDFLENAHEGPFEFGCTTLNVKPGTLKKIKEHVTVSPNGVAFLNSSVRKGVLPTMVEEILNTRLMVKKSMKAYKNDKILTRMLDARQLGLKLIANVTYGYTGASYSGRMPCIEVGDSIVRKARESLERAIELVRNTPKWGASVVYGDTDSMFIHLPGRSKEEAFKIGHEIADAVTAMFPKPMKLRFEKVYLPCVLQTKKRYVGFMYESADQKEPIFDAKGIETVRRDSCSAVSKILERSIKVLFSTHDLSRVRAYVTRQLHKLLEGKVGLLDLIFAKEFRGTMGYKPGACVPALEIARKRLRIDRRSEPRVGERVPYVIIHGSPGLPLIQLVREPWELVTDTTLRLNANYYITKQILPPLDRLFALIGINVFKWYSVMPKVVRVGHLMGTAQSTAKQGTISQFFATTNCPVCEIQTKKSICDNCRRDPQLVVWTLTAKIHDWDRTYNKLTQVCHTCQGIQEGEQSCVSLDCPILFRRNLAKMDLSRSDNLQQTLNKYLQF
ncbi:unnamed protein product [Lymnaea stagnalis]|uniref:DNA polymerase n=1 Tax=Lymnaea stagnalis TaxID=6523 RepID=A0AAV2HDM9_LYMST